MSCASKITLGLAAMGAATMAFQQPITAPSSARVHSASALQVVVDPTVVSKKDYEDICGVTFNDETLEQRLKRTSFLYPKHVEVVEDIAPIADAMVDEIVSQVLLVAVTLNDG
jgi:hypothetical protein